MDAQTRYWNGAAATAVFTHPLDIGLLSRHVKTTSRILDFGCGYGRSLAELRAHGFTNVTGVDTSEAMVERARRLVPGAPIAVVRGVPTPHADASFDAVLLFSVLTCTPGDEDQRRLLAEVVRLLTPGGILYLSDFLLQGDRRNRERYRRSQQRFATYGVFELDDGAVLRHHEPERILELTAAFEPVKNESFPVATMNGNPARGVRFLGRKTAGPPGPASARPAEGSP